MSSLHNLFGKHKEFFDQQLTGHMATAPDAVSWPQGFVGPLVWPHWKVPAVSESGLRIMLMAVGFGWVLGWLMRYRLGCFMCAGPLLGLELELRTTAQAQRVYREGMRFCETYLLLNHMSCARLVLSEGSWIMTDHGSWQRDIKCTPSASWLSCQLQNCCLRFKHRNRWSTQDDQTPFPYQAKAACSLALGFRFGNLTRGQFAVFASWCQKAQMHFPSIFLCSRF